jgi:hypothetical protein
VVKRNLAALAALEPTPLPVSTVTGEGPETAISAKFDMEGKEPLWLSVYTAEKGPR